MSSIFLSHSHADKDFVDRIASQLRRAGYYVWTDDAEIKVGDSLIDKIREGIDKVAYFGVVISRISINSEWVKKEVDIAMNQEIEGKKVKVIPILLDNVDLPGFLKGKKFADFRDNSLYEKSLDEIKKRLDETPSNKTTISSDEAKQYLEKLKILEDQLQTNKTERELLLKRLSIERKSLPTELIRVIEDEKKSYPEFEDINRNFAFLLSGIPVGVGYIFHVMHKMEMKGYPHQIFLLADAMDKNQELSLLIEAINRRIENRKDKLS